MEQQIKKANAFIQEKLDKVDSTYRNHYHLMAQVGWINDPNGFIYYNESYHLFYQYYPYDSVWGPMHWGHAKSNDLINWEHLPVALAPSEPYDQNGCFSGSAIEKDGELYLFYTGHVEVNNRVTQVQCLATSKDGINFVKSPLNPIIDGEMIKGIATVEDFRDPKVFQYENTYYMVVAAKTQESTGQILLFESKDLIDWRFKSVLLKGEEKQGIMWECPDLIRIGDKDVLLVSPIEFEETQYQYKNINSTVAFIGNVNWESGTFTVEKYQEIDSGLDFYAPQTCKNKNGENIMIAWMQMWKRNIPTDDLGHGWAGSMTLPRKLSIKNDKLSQMPADEIYKSIVLVNEKKNLILEEEYVVSDSNLNQNYYNFIISTKNNKSFTLNYGNEEHNCLEISYDAFKKIFSVSRGQFGLKINGEEKNSYSRDIEILDEADKLDLEVFIDTSSIEFFINQIYTVTITFYENTPNKKMTIIPEDILELFYCKTGKIKVEN
ncbi:glycoside hydrolase family 32 protein [Enterococcus bulliens]